MMNEKGVGFAPSCPLAISQTCGMPSGLSGRKAPCTRWAFRGRSFRATVQLPGVRTASSGGIQMAFNIGDRVRVVGEEELIMYHMPGMKKAPVNMVGLTGTIVRDVSLQDGVPVSATAPYVVEIEQYKNVKAHFAEHELEIFEDGASDA